MLCGAVWQVVFNVQTRQVLPLGGGFADGGAEGAAYHRIVYVNARPGRVQRHVLRVVEDDNVADVGQVRGATPGAGRRPRGHDRFLAGFDGRQVRNGAPPEATIKMLGCVAERVGPVKEGGWGTRS